MFLNHKISTVDLIWINDTLLLEINTFLVSILSVLFSEYTHELLLKVWRFFIAWVCRIVSTEEWFFHVFWLLSLWSWWLDLILLLGPTRILRPSKSTTYFTFELFILNTLFWYNCIDQFTLWAIHIFLFFAKESRWGRFYWVETVILILINLEMLCSNFCWFFSFFFGSWLSIWLKQTFQNMLLLLLCRIINDIAGINNVSFATWSFVISCCSKSESKVIYIFDFL